MSLVTPEVKTKTKAKQEEVEMTNEEAVVVEEQVENEVAVVEEQTTEVATAAEKRESGVQAFLSEQAEMGYEGIEVGAFSFDRIKLSEGKFLIGTDEVELGEDFKFTILATRSMYIVSQAAGEDSEVFYSYSADGSTKIDGSSSSDILDEWKEDGFGTEDSPLVIKKYLEVMVELIDRDDEYDSAIACLQVPPTSLQRFGGIAFMAKQRFKTDVGGVIVEALVGSKVGSGQKAFRPWNFKILRKA